ncbi:LysR family transcriptional regulator [Agrobacterium vitis]|uniref:LysR family transcriptional regulator n=1 Tax=Rhizobium/Agrobacterium group TaxID=227290 RepID=UPI00307EBAC4
MLNNLVPWQQDKPRADNVTRIQINYCGLLSMLQCPTKSSFDTDLGIDMEFAQLRHFVQLAEVLHFGQCAQKLGIAQPHLSRSISKLESEIGVRLFDRTSRQVSLTDSGRAFFVEAREILKSEQRAVQQARLATAKERHLIRLGFVSAASYMLMPKAIRLSTTIDNTHFELREATTNEQVQLLDNGHLDLGLGHPPIAPNSRIKSEVFLVDTFDAIVPEDHHLAIHGQAEFGQLAREPFIMFPETQGPILYSKIRELCRAAGHEFTVVHEASRLQTQLSLVAAGLGISLAQSQSSAIQVAGTKRLRIEPYPGELRIQLAAFWDARRRNTPLNKLLNRLRAIGKEQTDIRIDIE